MKTFCLSISYLDVANKIHFNCCKHCRPQFVWEEIMYDHFFWNMWCVKKESDRTHVRKAQCVQNHITSNRVAHILRTFTLLQSSRFNNSVWHRILDDHYLNVIQGFVWNAKPKSP